MAIAVHQIYSATIFELGAGKWKIIANTPQENDLHFEELRTFKNLALVVSVVNLQNREQHNSPLQKSCEASCPKDIQAQW